MMTERLHGILPFVLGRWVLFRSVTALILLSLMAMGLSVPSGAQQACQPNGDIDQNGSLTAADALLAFRQALSLDQLNVCQLRIADVFPLPATPDGNITASDALCIFQRALSLPSCLDSAPSYNQPPVVHVGQDLFADEGDTVYLSGLADDPDGSIVSFLWEQTGGPDVVLSGAETATASFTAPEVAAVQALRFQLTVTDDGRVGVTSDELTVTVRQVESAVLKVSVFGEGELKVVDSRIQLDCEAIVMCEGVFDRGRDIVIEASPAADWIHDGWAGCDQISGNLCTVNLRGNRLVSVTFVSGEPLQFEDNVIVLDDDQLDRIVSYEVDTGLLVVPPGMPGVNDWAVGDILLSDGIDSDPGRHLAFALRITLIEDQLGEIHIETYPASLAELFRSGSLRGAGQILDVGVPAIAAPGTAIVLEQRDSAVVGIDYKINEDVTVKGNLHFRFSNPEINFNRDPLEARVKLEVLAKPSLSVSIGNFDTGPLQRSSGISRERSFLLMELKRTVYWVTPPVMVKFRLLVHLTIKVFTNVLGIEPKATYDAAITAGVHYKSDRAAGERLQSIFEIRGQPSFSMEELATGFLTGERSLDDLKLGLEAGVRVDGEALFYGVTGPVISFHPYLGAKTCAWAYLDVYRGAGLEIGGKIKFPKFRWWKRGDAFSIGIDLPVYTFGPENITTIKLRPGDNSDSLVTVSDLEISDAGATRLDLRWSEPESGNCISGYNVYRDGRKIGNVTSQGEPRSEPEPIQYFDTGLKPDTAYCYRVAAVLPTGEEAMPGHEVCDKTLELLPPEGLHVEDPTSNSMLVTWIPPSNSDGISDYLVFQHTIDINRNDDYESAPLYDGIVVGSVRASEDSFRITGLQPATEYCFSVASVYENTHRSDPSGIVCGETTNPPLPGLSIGCVVIPQSRPPGAPIGLGDVSVVHWHTYVALSGPVGSAFSVSPSFDWNLTCGAWTSVHRGADTPEVCIRRPGDLETTDIAYLGRSAAIPQSGAVFFITSWWITTDDQGDPSRIADLEASSSSPQEHSCTWRLDSGLTTAATGSEVTDGSINIHMNVREEAPDW